MGIIEMLTAFAKLGIEVFQKCSAPIIEISVDLAKAIHALVTLIYWIKERVKDSVLIPREARRIAAEKQYITETVNVKDRLQNLDAAWKLRYDQILNAIKTKDTDSMITLIVNATAAEDKEAVKKILSMVESTPEHRAMEIITVMKRVRS